MSRASFRYESKQPEADKPLLTDIRKLKGQYPTWGYKKIHRGLVNQGWTVNRKRVARLWREHGYQQPKQKRRRKAPGDASNSCHIRTPQRVNQAWAIDFVQDQTADGRRLKLLTVVDEYSREALDIVVGRRMNHGDVISALKRLVAERGAPEFVRSDNGSEFIAAGVQQALAVLGVSTAYVAPGSPWQNGKNERFNGLLRQELLSREYFWSLKEAEVIIGKWREEFNAERPHGALNYKTPSGFAIQQKKTPGWWNPPPQTLGNVSPSNVGSAPLGATETDDERQHNQRKPD